MRETDEEAGARIELQGLFTVLNVVRVGQVHLFYRARLLDTDFAPGPETIEARLFSEDEIPWDELAFRTVRETLQRYFADRTRGPVRRALCRYHADHDHRPTAAHDPAPRIAPRSTRRTGRSALREDLIHPDPLLDCLVEVCRLHGQGASRAVAVGRPAAGRARPPHARAGRARRRARRHVGAAAAPARWRDIDSATLPAILILRDNKACVLLGWDATAGRRARAAAGNRPGHR